MREINPQRLRSRAAAARWIVVGAFGLLAIAFFRTQILQHERFRLQAAYNRLRPVPLTAARGSIYDREGRIIAETVPGYSVALLASNEDSLRQTLKRLSKWVPVDSGMVDAVVERFEDGGLQFGGAVALQQLRQGGGCDAEIAAAFGGMGQQGLACRRRLEKAIRGAVTAGGESGHIDSRHFNDQAERYATGNLRPVYFYPDQLQGHIERQYQPGK